MARLVLMTRPAAAASMGCAALSTSSRAASDVSSLTTRAATNHNAQPPSIAAETSSAMVESRELSALIERIVRENGDGIGFKLLPKCPTSWQLVGHFA